RPFVVALDADHPVLILPISSGMEPANHAADVGIVDIGERPAYSGAGSGEIVAEQAGAAPVRPAVADIAAEVPSVPGPYRDPRRLVRRLDGHVGGGRRLQRRRECKQSKSCDDDLAHVEPPARDEKSEFNSGREWFARSRHPRSTPIRVRDGGRHTL